MSREVRPGPACPEFEELLGYAHQELAAGRAEAVAAHVQTCAACAEEVRIMEQIGNGLGQMATAEAPPAGLREKILDRVKDAPARPRKNPLGWVQWALAACGVAIVAAIIFPIFSQAREQSRLAFKSPQGAAGAPPASAVPELSQQAEAPAPSAMGGAPAAPALQPQRYAADLRRRQNRDAASSYGGGVISPEDVQHYVRGGDSDLARRRVVQTADFALVVRRQLEDAEKELTTHIQQAGGYVEQSNLVSAENGDRTSSLTVRVPVEKFEETVGWLPALGEVKSKNVRGEDVTGRWIDERAEVRELREEEGRLLKQFTAARTPADRESARWALVQLRARIRASEERFAATAKMAALATLNISLTQTRRGAAGAGLLGDMTDTFGAAVGGFMLAVRVPLALLVWVLVFAPLWLPAVLIWRWISRARAEGLR